MNAVDVIVVGGGPTGVALANLLGQRARSCVVLERSVEPFPTPRACHLDAEIARIFQGLGLAEELRNLLTVSAGMEYVDARGKRLFTFEGFEREPLLGWHEDYCFVQPDLDALLRRSLTQWGTVRLELGVDVATITPSDDHVTVVATDGREWRGSFVVGCDGASSTVRNHLGIGLTSLGYDDEWLVVDVMLRRAVAMPGIIQQICDPERLATFVPSHGGHRRWEFRVGPGETFDEDDVWRLVNRWCGPDDGDLVRHAVYRFHAVIADRWRADRVFLAGDAAHQMPPFMGQGMCSGIRDAANLAWRLAAVLGEELPASTLNGYESERRPHVLAVTELSMQAGLLLDELAHAEVPTLPPASTRDPRIWSRLPPYGSAVFPIGHQCVQPIIDGIGFDEQFGPGAALVARVPVAGAPSWCRVVAAPPVGWYDHDLVLVRPDRYIAAVSGNRADVSAWVSSELERPLTPDEAHR